MYTTILKTFVYLQCVIIKLETYEIPKCKEGFGCMAKFTAIV